MPSSPPSRRPSFWRRYLASLLGARLSTPFIPDPLRESDMATTPTQALADSLMTHMGFTKTTAPRERTPEEICCGDPTNLDGNAHPWNEVGEDDQGTHYQCLVCGATDVD